MCFIYATQRQGQVPYFDALTVVTALAAFGEAAIITCGIVVVIAILVMFVFVALFLLRFLFFVGFLNMMVRISWHIIITTMQSFNNSPLIPI